IGFSGAPTVAIGGSFADNDLTNVLDAHVSGGASVKATGASATLTIDAHDDGTIRALTGAGAASASGGAGAGAFSTNDITDQVTAYVDGNPSAGPTTVSGRTVNIKARADQEIDTLTLAGAGASGFVVAASISLNKVHST